MTMVAPQENDATLTAEAVAAGRRRTWWQWWWRKQQRGLAAAAEVLMLAPYFIVVQPDWKSGLRDSNYFMSYLCTFTLYLLGCSHPCFLHIFWPREHLLVSFVSFLHVVWPCGFAFGYLQVMYLHDAEWAPVLSFHKKEPVSHLPTRHSTGSCFARHFLSHF